MIEGLITRFGAEEAESAEGIAALGFDTKAFVIQLITALIVIYILQRYVFGRVVTMLEKRREAVEESMRASSEAMEMREKLEKDTAKALAEARQEADHILARTQEQASQIIKDAEESAVNKANNLVSEARKKIDEETARARRKLEAEVVELVIEATEVVAGEKLDAKKDSALLTRALKGQSLS
jgi:F-type H+-transporting ATPase subunit b